MRQRIKCNESTSRSRIVIPGRMHQHIKFNESTSRSQIVIPGRMHQRIKFNESTSRSQTVIPGRMHQRIKFKVCHHHWICYQITRQYLHAQSICLPLNTCTVHCVSEFLLYIYKICSWQVSQCNCSYLIDQPFCHIKQFSPQRLIFHNLFYTTKTFMKGLFSPKINSDASS